MQWHWVHWLGNDSGVFLRDLSADAANVELRLLTSSPALGLGCSLAPPGEQVVQVCVVLHTRNHIVLDWDVTITEELWNWIFYQVVFTHDKMIIN